MKYKCEKRCAIYFHEFYFVVEWKRAIEEKPLYENEHWMGWLVGGSVRVANESVYLFVRALNRPDNAVFDSFKQYH